MMERPPEKSTMIFFPSYCPSSQGQPGAVGSHISLTWGPSTSAHPCPTPGTRAGEQSVLHVFILVFGGEETHVEHANSQQNVTGDSSSGHQTLTALFGNQTHDISVRWQCTAHCHYAHKRMRKRNKTNVTNLNTYF